MYRGGKYGRKCLASKDSCEKMDPLCKRHTFEKYDIAVVGGDKRTACMIPFLCKGVIVSLVIKSAIELIWI